MIDYRQVLKISIIIGVSGFLAACQTGHSFSTRYQNGVPVSKAAKNSPSPIPVPRTKPKPPKKYYAAKTSSSPRVPATSSSFRVRKGDTIYGLSRRHNVTVRSIIQSNGLKAPYLLYPGQRLKSPAMATHVVRKGDTVYSLSRKYRVDMTTFTRLNHMKRPYTLAIGQKLKVPSLKGAGRQQAGRKKVFLPPPPPQSGKGFMWPVKGPLLSSFGPKEVGYHNDGINIGAKAGSYVRAAESGVVVHAGQKIKGFGRLILIRHSNGWITAYAHNSSVLVNKGQSVKRGQAIARVGQSGGVNRPQLHFEMRKGSRAVNPVKYLS